MNITKTKGSRVRNEDFVKVFTELLSISKDCSIEGVEGLLTKDVLHFAKTNPDSTIYKYIEWDSERGLKQYQLTQIGGIISSVLVEIKTGNIDLTNLNFTLINKEKKYRKYWVNTVIDEDNIGRKQIYLDAKKVMSDHEKSDHQIALAFSNLGAWCQRFGMYDHPLITKALEFNENLLEEYYNETQDLKNVKKLFNGFKNKEKDVEF